MLVMYVALAMLQTPAEATERARRAVECEQYSIYTHRMLDELEGMGPTAADQRNIETSRRVADAVAEAAWDEQMAMARLMSPVTQGGRLDTIGDRLEGVRGEVDARLVRWVEAFTDFRAYAGAMGERLGACARRYGISTN